MSEVGAPAPAAPAAPAAAPSAPAATPAAGADPRGAPPRGHKWGPAQPAPAGKVPVPTQPRRSPQQVSTGEPAPKSPQVIPPTQKPTQPLPTADEVRQEQRAARLEKFKTADGQEVEVDVSEFLERAFANEKRKVKVNGQEREITIAEALERFPLAEGAHQRFREAHEIEQRAKGMEEQLKRGLQPLTDPKQALAVLTRIHGAQQAQQMMEEHLAAIYQREAMPAEQRQALEQREAAQREIQAERQKLEAEKAEWQAKQQAEQKQRYDAEYKAEVTRLQRDVPILLKKAGFWPEASPNADAAEVDEINDLRREAMGYFAEYAQDARAIKRPDYETWAAEQVAARMQRMMRLAGRAYDPEVLRGLLGKNADKIRQAEVDRIIKQPGRGRPIKAAPGKLPEGIRTPDQLRKFLREQDLAAERRGR